MRKNGELTASWSSSAKSRSGLATTAAAGRPSAISSAKFGPESTATGRSRTSVERRSLATGVEPLRQAEDRQRRRQARDHRGERVARDGDDDEVGAGERRVG